MTAPQAAARIRNTGQRVARIIRVFPDPDRDGYHEVLFLEPGTHQPLTAYLHPTQEPLITIGW